jgi:hypothetical protein
MIVIDCWQVVCTIMQVTHMIEFNVQAYSQISPEGDSFQDRYGDAVSWGGCTILYLLGQQLRFELLDFTSHVLSAAEAEALPSAQELLAERSKSGSAAYSMVLSLFLNL